MSAGDSVRAGRVVGRLVVLGRRHKVVAPAGAAGQVLSVSSAGAVQYGDALVSLGAATAVDGAEAEVDATASEEGYPVCTPIDGIFYARPTPDAPAYVSVGDRVTEGATLGLVEVMKTFNPVTLGGAGAPKSGVVSAVLAQDGDEVRANEPLFRIVAE
ncbi:MAG: acetyl-CoA carboxylase biotin carboxyl carrier protein [Deltaproteobacteria bacterium]|nr:acetyl-CoA carboxylase biotin carboxyl carrier protein [Deltaproteobacteria bacterium]